MVGTEVPCSIDGIHGSTSSVRPSTGVPSLAFVIWSCTAFVPTAGGWGDVRTCTTSAPELLVVVTYGEDWKVTGPEGAGAGLEHADTRAAAAEARRSCIIVVGLRYGTSM